MVDSSLSSSLLSNGFSDRSSSVDTIESLSPGSNTSSLESPEPRRDHNFRCRVIWDESGLATYGCCECAECFLAPRILERHLRDAHPWLRSVCVCPQCGRRFLHSGHVLRHRRELHEEAPERAHQCRLCDKRFKRAEHLRGHERASHGRRRDFACAHCGRTFARRDHAQRHERLVHRPDHELRCGHCGKRFRRVSALARHRGICSEATSREQARPEVRVQVQDEPRVQDEVQVLAEVQLLDEVQMQTEVQAQAQVQVDEAVVLDYEEDDWIKLLVMH